MHGLTKIQFLELYPGYPLVSKRLRDKARETCKKQWKDNYYRKLIETHSIESKQKRRESRFKKATTLGARFKKSRGI